MQMIPAPARLLVAGAVVAGTVLSASPARADVTFDFAAHTGYAGATELRQAFGWDAAALRKHAAGIAFTRDTLVQDVYSVVCGPAGTQPVRAVHAREFGKYFLTSTVDRDPKGGVRGLRITGADAGISGTTVPPTPGMPCPGTDGDPSRSTVPQPAPATPKGGVAAALRAGTAAVANRGAGASTAGPTGGTAPGPTGGTAPGSKSGTAPRKPGKVRTVTLMSTTTTMTLIVKSADVARELVELRNGPEVPS